MGLCSDYLVPTIMFNFTKFLALFFLFFGGQLFAQKSAAAHLQVLSQQGPNLSSWVLAPIDRSIPDAIRQNVTFLREDLVDEGKTKPQASLDAYRVAYQYCSTIIAVLDEREKMLLKAGYRAVQANVVTPATNQALEARRNYLMSWPQYEREVQQRNDLLRVNEAADKRKVELALQELKLEWARRGDALRANLDGLYIKLRAALRDSGGTTKTFDAAQGGSSASVPAMPVPPTSTPNKVPSTFSPANLNGGNQFTEYIQNVFPPRSDVPIRLAVNKQTDTSDIFMPPRIPNAKLTHWEFISTNEHFKPPVEVCVEAKTDSTNLRLSYAADQVIFNWEQNKHELRLDGGPAHGLHKAGAGLIPVNQYVKIRWIVLPNKQEIYVDDQLRYTHEGDYSKINKRVSVFCAQGSIVLVKSIKVRRLDSAPAASVTTMPVTPAPLSPTASTPQNTFTNSLGMKFVPVPGTQVMMCIHETRHSDYAAYAVETQGMDGQWKNQTYDGFAITERHGDHPVANVSWEDAQNFCAWLSQKEGMRYRLPTDEEWSIAVGLGGKEKRGEGTTPEMLNQKENTEFPWGGDFPPKTKEKAGNYSDASHKAKAPSDAAQYPEDYDDGFPTTAPVMSFKPNKLGLYDLGGNVWEWCEDWSGTAKKNRVLRGGSWFFYAEGNLLSSCRNRNTPTSRYYDYGFRCVLVVHDSKTLGNNTAPPASVPTAQQNPPMSGAIVLPNSSVVKVRPNSPNGYDLGAVAKGELLTLRYLSGKWKSYGRIATESPDSLEQERGDKTMESMLVVAEPAGPEEMPGSIIAVVQPRTETAPFQYISDKDYPRLVLRVLANSRRKENPGEVAYLLHRTSHGSALARQPNIAPLRISQTPFLTKRADSSGCFINTLGMQFVLLPGSNVMMCIHETRNADYAAYTVSEQTNGSEWRSLANIGADHPVTNVNYREAEAFCHWLSKKEGKSYRLPTDEEWSLAVGLGRESGNSPAQKSVTDVGDVYPWGDYWPPRPEDGNYGFMMIDDGYITTAPVMSFRPNALGLYDLGGNVSEWCKDYLDGSNKNGVHRGRSWANYDQDYLRSKNRESVPLDMQRDIYGFRCVIEIEGS